jgi:predicted nucleic acid-binding protein
MILVDTSVLLDIVKDDPIWSSWSLDAFEKASGQSDMAINDIIYAELSSRYETVEGVDYALATLGLNMLAIPRSGLFLAGKAYKHYRARRGTKTGVLPDFLVGAHAAVAGGTLLTRDPTLIRSYFPTVALITPQM